MLIERNMQMHALRRILFRERQKKLHILHSLVLVATHFDERILFFYVTFAHIYKYSPGKLIDV